MGETFEPLYANRMFWEAQGVPLLALLAFVGLQVARKRAADEEARRRDQWRKEKDAELATMQRRRCAGERALRGRGAGAAAGGGDAELGASPDTLDGAGSRGMRVCWTRRWRNGCGNCSTGRRRCCMRGLPGGGARPRRKRGWIYWKQ